jgi:hypothetical protein
MDASVAARDRWTLVARFDDHETQVKAAPETAFPFDDVSRMLTYLGEQWFLSPEELQDVAEWDDTSITVHCENLDMVSFAMRWLTVDTVPVNVELRRNGDRLW